MPSGGRMAIINLRLSIIYMPMREFRCLTDICGRVYANLSAAFNMIFSLFPSCFLPVNLVLGSFVPARNQGFFAIKSKRIFGCNAHFDIFV